MATPGLGTNKLTLFIDTDPDTGTGIAGELVAVTPEVSRASVITAESDADFVSFADAAAGGAREYRLALTFVQLASLWKLTWENAGDQVNVVVRPFGNATPTVSQPHFSGTVTITEPDGDFIGGEADASSTARLTNEVEWVFTAKPTRVTA